MDLMATMKNIESQNGTRLTQIRLVRDKAEKREKARKGCF